MTTDSFPVRPARLSSLPDRLSRAWLRLPWWASVLIIFAAARLVSYWIFAAVARTQPENYWTGAHPGYFKFVTIWDSDWYRTIAEHGYPAQLPLDEAGHVAQNQWAFYPIYSYLVRGVDALTGLGWTLAAPSISLLAGFATALVGYRLLRHHLPHAQTLTGIAFFASFPTAAVLQTGYAESLSLFFLVVALWGVQARRYVAVIPVIIAMDLTRPLGVAFAFFMAIHIIQRVAAHRREAYPLRQVLASLVLGVVSCAGALAWPAIAWAVTGRSDAYTATEAAWTGGAIHWVAGWFYQSVNLFGTLAGPIVLVLVIAGMLAFIVVSGRVIGRDMQAWCLAYGCYLLLVFYPQTSIFRLLLPLFPLGFALSGASRSTAYRVSVIAGFTLLQIVWIAWLWRFTPPSDLPP